MANTSRAFYPDTPYDLPLESTTRNKSEDTRPVEPNQGCIAQPNSAALLSRRPVAPQRVRRAHMSSLGG